MNMTMTYDGTMVMPKNYAVVTEDEMTYVDGGAYIDNQTLQKVMCVMAFCPIPTVCIAIGYYKLTTLIAAGMAALCSKLGALGGPIGFGIGLAVGCLGAGYLAGTFADALIQGKGIVIEAKTTFLGAPYGVNIYVD